MPLIIDLKPGEKMIINGAVIENAGTNTKFRILNDCSLLRQKEILSSSDSVTPASRVYYALQCAYIFSDKSEEHMRQFNNYLSAYVAACPSASSIADSIADAIGQGQLYKGLKMTRRLLDHESKVLNQFRDETSEPAAESSDNPPK